MSHLHTWQDRLITEPAITQPVDGDFHAFFSRCIDQRSSVALTTSMDEE
ncbi:MAG: hypothetical protein H7839_16530 [Magnetococcus sp. YQC-5]